MYFSMNLNIIFPFELKVSVLQVIQPLHKHKVSSKDVKII